MLKNFSRKFLPRLWLDVLLQHRPHTISSMLDVERRDYSYKILLAIALCPHTGGGAKRVTADSSLCKIHMPIVQIHKNHNGVEHVACRPSCQFTPHMEILACCTGLAQIPHKHLSRRNGLYPAFSITQNLYHN